MNIQSFKNTTVNKFRPNVKLGLPYVGADAFAQMMKNTHRFTETNPNKTFYNQINSSNIYYNNETPTKEIDFTYNSTEELFEQISKRYDMEDMEPWDLCQVLGMLKQGGVITNEEYWLAQSVIPVIGSTSDFPRPEEFENALEDYYANFETFVKNNAHLYSPAQAQKLHDSMLVHKKMEGIFKQIQAYR